MKSFLIVIVLLIIAILSCYSKNNNKTVTPNYYQGYGNDCNFQNSVYELGLGVAIWNYNCENHLTIFNNSELTDKIIDINICESHGSSICPIFYKPDYGIFNFVVIGKFNKAYKILFNKDEYGYIASDKDFKFVNWKTFLTEYTSGIRLKKEKEIYVVKKVIGDTIFSTNLDNTFNRKIVWRTKNKVLIDIFLLK